MSLKDTIRGAREEAEAAGTALGRAAADKSASAAGGKTASDEATKSKQQGFSKRSATRGKPARKASSGVRVVKSDGSSKSKANMSKEERKAENKRERERDDRRYSVTQMILDDNPDYKARRKKWWIFLIVGIVLVVAAFGAYGTVNNMAETDPNRETLAFVAIVLMVVAYGAVIAGIIYDWRKIRPMRKEVEKRTASMSDKKLINMLNKGDSK